MNKTSESPIGEMSIMDESGHSRITWRADESDQIAAAREVFDKLLRKGYTAFGSKEKAAEKHTLQEFDPAMEDLVMVPRTVGG